MTKDEALRVIAESPVRKGQSWRHAKTGDRYKVIVVAVEASGGQPFVVYAGPDEVAWVRPLAEFLGQWDGKPRFSLVEAEVSSSRVVRGDEDTRMSKRSGSVESTIPLVAVLYDLLKEHAPPAVLEALVRDAEAHSHKMKVYTNGWLASYAIDIARRLADAPGPVSLLPDLTRKP